MILSSIIDHLCHYDTEDFMQTFRQQLERISRKLTPATLCFLMVLFAAVPWHIAGLNRLMPAFTLINIYYWGVFYPGALPYLFLFALGLVQDSLGGTPIGLTSFVNLAFAFLLVFERGIFGKTIFRSMWAGFSTLSAVVLILRWIVLSFYSGHLLSLGDTLLQWLVSCLFYPLMHVFLTRIYRTFIEV